MHDSEILLGEALFHTSSRTSFKLQTLTSILNLEGGNAFSQPCTSDIWY